jgi:type IX secretion system substrate protein
MKNTIVSIKPAAMMLAIFLSLSASTHAQTLDGISGITSANTISMVVAMNAQSAYGNPYIAGISIPVSQNDLLVYPNPVISQTRIVLPEASAAPVFVDIVDLNGNVVRTYRYEPGIYNLDVDMSRLPAGLYSLRVSGKYISDYREKVIKE